MRAIPSVPWTERERAEFKRRVAALEAGGGGGGGGATDLAYNAATRLLSSSTGADATLPLVGTDAGLMSAADKTKLNGVATGATANSPDATLLDRANHTGTQVAATISDFAAAVAALITGKANTVHSHVSTDVSDSGATGRSLLQAATAAIATAILNVFTSADKGLVPASGGGTTNFLRADGSWAAPSGGGGGSGPSPAIVWVL